MDDARRAGDAAAEHRLAVVLEPHRIEHRRRRRREVRIVREQRTTVLRQRSRDRPEVRVAALLMVEDSLEHRDIAHAVDIIAHQAHMVIAVQPFVRALHAMLCVARGCGVRRREHRVRHSSVRLEGGRAPEIL